jgi:hypothetical protein
MEIHDNTSPEKKLVPTADGEASLSILKGLARDRSLLTAMKAMQDKLGNIFQIGSRNYIGTIFAQIEGKVVLSRILQQFELKLSPDQEIWPHMGATLEPRPSVRMNVKRRHEN